VFANHAWEELCGWNAEEIKGQHGLSFLQGPETEKLRLKRVSAAVKYGEVCVLAACWLLCVQVSAESVFCYNSGLHNHTPTAWFMCCMAGRLACWLAGWLTGCTLHLLAAYPCV
jgi:hypothetical protein